MYFWQFYVYLDIFHTWCFFLQIWHSLETFQKILKSSGHINTIWNRLAGKFQIIWKYQDSFETIRKVLKSSGNILAALKLWRKFWHYMEISRQFCTSLRRCWKIQTVLKPFGKAEVIRKCLDSFENKTGRFWSHPERFEQLWNCLESFETVRKTIWKCPNSFETVWKILK